VRLRHYLTLEILTYARRLQTRVREEGGRVGGRREGLLFV